MPHIDRHYEGLTLCCLTPDRHEQSCGYWYTVIGFGATPHTAFRTRAALDFWLAARGLTLQSAPPETVGTHSVIRIEGAYIHRMHTTTQSMPASGEKLLVLSNARYTTGRITEQDGVRVIHFANPNSERPEIPYELGRRHEDSGHASEVAALL